ncbi:diacylglycerol kinase family protein [Chryseomicrobium sp. FSL W7-1435]|uniref:diacylglycerol kinase family protein n=1 Tax=Chryseomicrobium sp. FSL W7-1435 TaxID=2921704 RepID=UPI003159C32E
MREVQSFKNALVGVMTATKNERHMKFHLLAAICTILAAFLLKFTAIEWIVLLLTISGMLTLEMINTAIERFVDLVEPNWNEKAGQVKDIAAGACFIYACGSAVIGCILYIPKIIELVL